MGQTVLVGILDWGLGHASRSVPLIRRFIQRGYEPVIMSSGMPLHWLSAIFPSLPTVALPSLRIRYPSRFSALLPWHTAWQLWHRRKMLQNENAAVEKWVRYYRPAFIYSDNRPGFFSSQVPSYYLTHQLHVTTPFFSGMASAVHRHLMRHFHEIWVPDFKSHPNLSGKLGHPQKKPENLKYLGPLSRYDYKRGAAEIDWLIVLSGPEKQRTVLENNILRHQHLFEGKVCLIRGTHQKPLQAIPTHWDVVDLANNEQLGNAALKARRILSRSGYSSIMDWFVMQRQAVLIPTPGQPEQLYLANHLSRLGLFPYVHQHRLDDLQHISYRNYYSFHIFPKTQSYA